MPESTPFFSVIIPSYNRANLLKDVIKSVTDQTFSDWELILVDDGSTDNTRETMKSITDPRVKYVYQENKERSAARNKGISISTGKYICFLDNDDFYLPFHLQSFHDKIVEKNYADGLYLSGHIIREGDKEISRSAFFDSSYKNAVTFAFEKLLFPNDVCLPRHIAIANPFPEQFNIFEDGHTWMRILSKYPLFQNEQHTCIVNEHPDRSTNKIFEKIDVEYLKRYITALQHLFTNYGDMIEPFYPREKWNQFITSKLITVAQIAISRGKIAESRQILKFMVQKQPKTMFKKETLKLSLLSVMR